MDTYRISTGRNRKETEWKEKAIAWSKLESFLTKCRYTPESVSDYARMTKAQKAQVKDVGGFVGGAVSGRRKSDSVTARSLVTLDIDYGQKDTPDIIADVLYGAAWCLYSTHSHTKESPRYRLVVPLSREVTPDEYIPIARRMADDIGIDLFDSSTYEPCRLMYWPSCPRDGEFVFRFAEGDPYDADSALGSYNDWRDVAEWPMDKRTLHIAEGRGSKQEDPKEKSGIIGTFCRCYGIAEAIDAFLPDVYEATGKEGRYTFKNGTTEAGLVVYDNTFAYSHHGTDPCCEKLCNAFDLVRLHKFADEDKDADINTPIAKMPSFIAMERFARADKKVAELAAEEKIHEINDEFGDAGNGADTEWIKSMQMDERKKAFLPSPYNFGLIVKNDPRLKGCARRDLFKGRDVITRDLPWRPAKTDPFWNNSDDNGLIDYVSKSYRLTAKTTLLDANDLAVSQNCYNPVKDYLDALEWDGADRLDRMLIDYLGAEDTALTRAMTRKHFTAAVARVYKPGCKYDYVLTLIGPEGIGKSSLIREMGGEWFDDSLTSIEGKDGMEQVRGRWLVEFGELTNYKKSTSEAYKAFISKQEDAYRPAYGRKVEVYPRQCVFFATTNESAFLKGDTGNRRFWPVECGVDLPEKDVWSDLPGEVPQLWAEAVVRYKAGEPLYLNAEMTAQARALQEGHNEVAADDRAGMIQAFLARPIPDSWGSMTLRQRQDYFKIASDTGVESLSMKRRDSICSVELLSECFGQSMDEKTRYRTKEINQILKRMGGLEYMGSIFDKTYGKQRRFRITDAFFENIKNTDGNENE